MFRRDGPRFPPGTGLVPEQNFIISVFISLFILVPLAALQNPRCFPCDLANFAFGTMVPEHLTSLSYSKQVLFRNIFSIFAKNHEVPGQFNSKGAGVPVRFAPLLSSLHQNPIIHATKLNCLCAPPNLSTTEAYRARCNVYPPRPLISPVLPMRATAWPWGLLETYRELTRNQNTDFGPVQKHHICGIL